MPEPSPEMRARLLKHAELVSLVERLPSESDRGNLLAIVNLQKPTARDPGVATGRELKENLEARIADSEWALQKLREKMAEGLSEKASLITGGGIAGFEDSLRFDRAMLRTVLEHKLHEHE